MSSAAVRKPPVLTRRDFRAFVATRPDEEHWELIGGVAMMMNPPTKAHQRIASNLERLLNDALELHDPSKAAYQRIGVTIDRAPDYDPEPDVVVIDVDEPDERYATRVHLVAEIVSASDASKAEAKRAVYRLHPTVTHILTIEQTRAEVRVETRDGEVWTATTAQGLDAFVDLPLFGLRFRLVDLYRRTELGS